MGGDFNGSCRVGDEVLADYILTALPQPLRLHRGAPGVGKNRIIRVAKRYMNELPEFHFAPTSMTGASLVDSLVTAKRFIARLPDPPLEYNCLTITQKNSPRSCTSTTTR